MKDLLVYSFNNTAETGQVLSPLPMQYPQEAIPETLRAWKQREIEQIDGKDSLDNRWDHDKIAEVDRNSNQSVFFASGSKGKLSRLLVSYKHMLSLSSEEDNETQWKQITLLKSATEIRSILAQTLHKALDQIERDGYTDDRTNNALVRLSVNTAYINEALTQALVDFMNKNPDPEYDDGEKRNHFLFENALNKGAEYHIADIRHGGVDEQCMRIVESLGHIANNNALGRPPSGKEVAINQTTNFDSLVKNAVFGSPIEP